MIYTKQQRIDDIERAFKANTERESREQVANLMRERRSVEVTNRMTFFENIAIDSRDAALRAAALMRLAALSSRDLTANAIALGVK